MACHFKIGLVVFFLLMAHAIHGQDHNLKRLSLEEGLSQSSVIDMVQDKKGFLWIGTMDGLNCFDGHLFKVFKNEPFDSTSLSVNYISTLMVDDAGGLWVGTRGGGLHYYISEKNEFIRFRPDPQIETSLSNEFITDIHQDRAGRIWVGTTNGLNLILPFEEGKEREIEFKRFLFDPERSRKDAQSPQFIRALFNDSDDRLWIGTAVNLIRFDDFRDHDSSPKVRVFEFNENEKQTLSGKTITAIHSDEKQNIWIGTYSGLNLFLDDDKGFQRFYKNDRSGGLPNNEILSITRQSDGKVLITTFEGICEVHYSEDDTEGTEPEFRQIDIPEYSMSIVRKVEADRLNKNILWIGTAESGLIQFNRQPKQFFSNDLNRAKDAGLMTPSIFGICKDNKGSIWMSSQNGLLQYQREEDKFSLFQYGKKEKGGIEGRFISSMLIANDGSFWAGTYSGLHKFTGFENGKPTFRFYRGDAESVENAALCLYQDKNDNIYIGTFTGLNIYQPHADSILPHPVVLDKIAASNAEYQVKAFLMDRHNNLWVGTSKGLILLENINDPVRDIKTATPKIFYHNEYDRTSIRNDYITSLAEDNKGRIFAATYNGLIEVRKSGDSVSFHSYTENEGLSNNLIYAILKDNEKGHLWLSTNNGLSRFDTELKTFDNYYAEDGLQSNEFNSGAYSRSADGEMFFGGVNGYTSFYPGRIKSETSLPPVWLSTLTTLQGKQFNLLENEAIELPYRQNSFSVEFVGLNYANPERVEYAYSLDPDKVNWIYLGNARRVDFTKLSPGKYTLKIKASNHDGIWNDNFATAKIEINGPFWKSGWFYALIILLLGLFAYYLHRLRWSLKMKKLAEIDRFRKITSQDFHDELGSKLTIISLFSEITRDKLNGDAAVVGPYLDKVIDTSNSLYHSMKDLIWALNPEQDTVYDLAIQIKDFGDDLFDKTEVDFRTEGLNEGFVSKELPMEYKRHILLVFKEAMNNVLKHSDCQSVCLRLYNGNNALKIELEDDGIGFDAENQEFFGDGLNNMASRAERISALLKINSRKGGGTSVLLECPLEN